MKIVESNKFKRNKKDLNDLQTTNYNILLKILYDSCNFQDFCDNPILNLKKFDFKKRQGSNFFSFRLDNKICRLLLEEVKKGHELYREGYKVILIEIDFKKRS